MSNDIIVQAPIPSEVPCKRCGSLTASSAGMVTDDGDMTVWYSCSCGAVTRIDYPGAVPHPLMERLTGKGSTEG